MSKYIHNLIKQGESQKLDFKYEISDSKKIARTFVAFANTDGGKLLVGVKDNGSISGIRSDEEYHMIQAAADLYCKPEINFSEKIWTINGKTLMEVIIPKSGKMPHYAPDKNGKWKAWTRINDQNILVNDVILEVWKRKKSKKGTFIRYSDIEEKLLNYLDKNNSITISKFCRLFNIKRRLAKKTLINLISIGVLTYDINEKTIAYKLVPP
ncbi:helix-turn-helix domain-containing protein [Bacteroidota bacterium]